MNKGADCPLCYAPDPALLIWQNAFCYVVAVDDPDYPGYCRLIVKNHIAEMSELPLAEATYLLRLLLAIEQAQRQILQPDKINLASLGNKVPHLHWHLIPRFIDDRHFPEAVWALPSREPRPHPERQQLLPLLHHAIKVACQQLYSGDLRQ
ncbi:MAG: HIT family protein [Gammaproteobacteria bacterium]|nr:HIT family protein [Gammaproteobacteria bacterium]